ncbi:MAG: alpha/beta hydrolase [Rhodobacteraceae bacterium]|nr:alpha/beta hydrolase [Paracoccaceae bacterium]
MTLQMIDGPSGQLATYSSELTQGPTIVLLHGDIGRASQWDAVATLLETKARIISLDSRGHGASDPADDYTYAARAKDLDLIVRHFGLTNYIVVAHSGSVSTALEFGATAEHLRGIFLVDPATDPSAMPDEMRDGYLGALQGPGALDAIQGYYASIAGTNPETIALVQRDAAAADEDARFGIAKSLAYWNPRPSLAGYSGPLEALITPANDNDAALYHLGDGFAVQIIEATGHWPQLDAPQTVADAIMGFIVGLNPK